MASDPFIQFGNILNKDRELMANNSNSHHTLFARKDN